MTEPLLDMRVSLSYGPHQVLHDLQLEMQRGEILGLVGQSGSGKSSLALALLGLLRWKGGRVEGSIRFEGRDLLTLPRAELRKVRRERMALVPQSPIASLNPALRLESQLREDWRAGRIDRERLLASVDLPSDSAFLRKRPGDLSVGMAQRFLIAMALRHVPALLIADEPTSALDALIQADILRLIREVNRNCGTSVLFISHDLASVASIADRVAILNEGKIVECEATRQVFENPAQPYTRKLIEAIAWRAQSTWECQGSIVGP